MNRVLCAAAISLSLFSTASAHKPGESGASHKRREPITWAPAEFPISTSNAWTKHRLMVASLRADGLSVELEQTDIMKTSKRYHAKLGAEGDAADFSQWLCFVGGHKDQRWALWLTSGEIDGGMISDFTLKRVGSDANVDSRCRSLSASLEEPTTSPTKLQLGMSESDLTLALGAPTSRRSDLFYYAYQHDFKRHGEPYTLMNTITVRIKNGVVVGIKIWKSTQS